MTEENPCNHPTILVLEDDVDTLDEVSEALSDEGFHTLRAESILALGELTESHVIDLFLIDLNLPDGNGLSLAREIRGKSDVGIIIVSGKTSEIDRVVGLEIGADDYITKPFSPRELLARVQSVLRRTKGSTYPDAISDSAAQQIVEFLDWTLDLGSHHLVAKDGNTIELTTAEFYLLRAFAAAPKRVLSRDFLLDQVHDYDWFGSDRGVDGLVSRVRKKFKQPVGTSPLIKTVRGAGYMFTPNVRKR